MTEKNLGDPEACVANPINAGTGNKYQTEADYHGGGPFPLQFTRYYNSQANQSGRMGHGWRAFGGVSIITPDFIKAVRPDQQAYGFLLVNGAWLADADVTARLIQFKDIGGTVTGWELALPDGTTEHYDANGTLTAIQQPSGLSHSIANAASSHVLISDNFGRSLTLDYNTQNQLETLTDPAGGMTTYGYDANGNLASVTYPDGQTRTYHYEDSRFPHALTGITDENGVRYATWTYDDQGRAIASEHAGGADHVDLAYNPDGGTTVTDTLGAARSYGFRTVLGMVKGAGIAQPGGAGCGAASSAISHDANGNVTHRDDFNGHRTRYWHDPARNLETTRVEGLALVSSSETTQPETRTVTTAWHPAWRLPLVEKTYTGGADSVGLPQGTLLKTVTSTYDASGNLLTHTETDNLRNESRAWTTTWTSLGRIKTVDGPRTDVADVTTYDYYPDGDADLARRGRLWKITNALGQVTQVLSYDLHGHPTQTQDANGLLTTLAYTPRGWLKTRQVGQRLTTYTYDNTGQLTRVDLPGGASLSYTHDAAHRLTDLRNAQGDHLHYDLDSQGHITAETIADAQGAQASKLTRQYDALGRLWKEIRRINGQDAVTEYGYDAQGNPTLRADPLNHARQSRYDALDRLARTEDALQGHTDLARDVLDGVTSVTDPKGHATTYETDAFGQVRRETSPDRGITTYTYDPAGNLKTRSDARGKTLAYSYDALNRLTKVDRPSGTDTTFIWDQGANALGRLTGMTDESGSTTWSYNPYGEVTGKIQTHAGGFTRTVTHTYLNGQRTRIDYPSGAYVDYAWSQGRITEVRLNGALLLSNLQYQPFGAPQALSWGNGQVQVRSFDADTGWPKSHPVGTDTRALAYDAAGRLTGYVHTQSSLDQNFSYDALDRLTGNTTYQGSQGYAYDANGNRTQITSSSTSYPYTLANDSNRLLSVSGPVAKSYQYDAAGNITGDGTYAFTYNDYGRINRATLNGKFTVYLYNGQGARVEKSGRGVTNGPLRFVYDEDGKLLGEYGKNGALVQETIWLGDMPVAVRMASGTYFIQADHLNTPRALLDSSNKLVWRWDGDPFGVGRANEDPDRNKVKVSYSLRMPGQYYDSETGLHYNFFRDYEPRTGRYVQSDPIGVAGGLNLYTYVGGNPISLTDPLGLAPQQNFPGSSCGPEGDPNNFPNNWTGNYEPACQWHDWCYSKCGVVKFYCDNSFYQKMLWSCGKISMSEDLFGTKKSLCLKQAWAYFFAVSKLGQKPFDKAQKSCQCKQ